LVLTQEERSENTIAVTSMSRTRAEAVRVIAEGVKRLAEKAAAGKLISHNKISYGDVRGILKSARVFLADKRKQIRARENSRRTNRTKGHHLKTRNETCGGFCIAGSIIDGLLIVDNMQAVSCKPLVVLVWWVQGIVTLMVDQGLSFVDALFTLTQQITTVGYGSDTPTTKGMKIFHALHSVVGVTLAAKPTFDIIDEIVDKMIEDSSKFVYDAPFTKTIEDSTSAVREKAGLDTRKMWLKTSLPLAMTVIASSLGYGVDLKMEGEYASYGEALLDSIYMMLISLTTVGYGDITPMSDLGKFLMLPTMMFGTRLFARTFEYETPTAKDGDTNLKEEAVDTEFLGCGGDAFLTGKLKMISRRKPPRRNDGDEDRAARGAAGGEDNAEVDEGALDGRV